MGSAMGSIVVARWGSSPHITVLLAVYDTPPALLKPAVESICRQSWEDFELLILDDGSRSDATLDCLRELAKNDSRIRLLREPHRGLTATLNRGVALARGKWIARQDADDWSEPCRLSRQAAWLASNPAAILCGSNAFLHREDASLLWPTRLPLTGEEIARTFWSGNPFVHGSVMFASEAARGIGGYREEFPCSQDYDFFWRMSERGVAVNLAEPLYHYRYTSGSVSARRAFDQARSHRAAQILSTARRGGGSQTVAQALQEADTQLGRRVWFRCALKQADHRLLAGDHGGALMAYSGLCLRRPWDPLGWGKLVRSILFASVPAVRQASFG